MASWQAQIPAESCSSNCPLVSTVSYNSALYHLFDVILHCFDATTQRRRLSPSPSPRVLKGRRSGRPLFSSCGDAMHQGGIAAQTIYIEKSPLASS
jgi:hypothetical protein